VNLFFDCLPTTVLQFSTYMCGKIT
jgi:hypothetical protein